MRKCRNIVVSLAAVMLGSILTAVAAPAAVAADAFTISFLYEDSFAGVDPPTTSWSTNDTMVLLPNSGHWDLLNGTADVYGYNDSIGLLTHRGTRGLGVNGNEDDEVDSYGRPERIEITFDAPHYLSYLEVRSLFDNEGPGGEPEEGDIDLYLRGNFVANYHIVGVQGSGTNGTWSKSVPDILVDKIVYYVKKSDTYWKWSEFAVAKLVVKPAPSLEEVPAITPLGFIVALVSLFGLAAVAMREYIKGKQKEKQM